jgi:phosphomannomutase
MCMSEELIGKFDIRGTEETGLTVECAWNVGKAVADMLSLPGQVVVVALTSETELTRAVIEGLRLQGRNVLDGGDGDKDSARDLIAKMGLAGAVVIGYDETDHVSTIELYQEDGRLIDSESGLHGIRASVEAGNFVPAAVKGELTALA